jgi:hypothetical protein
MKTLYLDCISGISGDMMVGALVDLGVKPTTLEWELSKLPIGDFHLHFDRRKRQEIEGVKFSIHAGAVHTPDQDEAGDGHAHSHTHEHGHECCDHDHDHDHDHGHEHGHEHDHGHGDEVHAHPHEHEHARAYRDIRSMIEASDLSPSVKQRALGIFQRIAVAEGKIHGIAPEAVHFHEVGALDSIADIVMSCVGIEALGVDKVFASALHDGCGTVECAHGTFPVPAPATLELLRGIPLGQIDEPHELITPTGAAIVAEFSEGFGPMPSMKIERIGYGIGTRELASRPNVLRAVLGEPAES